MLSTKAILGEVIDSQIEEAAEAANEMFKEEVEIFEEHFLEKVLSKDGAEVAKVNVKPRVENNYDNHSLSVDDSNEKSVLDVSWETGWDEALLNGWKDEIAKFFILKFEFVNWDEAPPDGWRVLQDTAEVRSPRCKEITPQSAERQKWDLRVGNDKENLLAVAEEVNQSEDGVVKSCVVKCRASNLLNN